MRYLSARSGSGPSPLIPRVYQGFELPAESENIMTPEQLDALKFVIDYLLALQPDSQVSQNELDGLKSLLFGARQVL